MRREPSLASASSIPHFYNVNLAQFPSYGNPIWQPRREHFAPTRWQPPDRPLGSSRFTLSAVQIQGVAFHNCIPGFTAN